MRHFADILLQRTYDLCEEIIAIEKLFLERKYGSSIFDVFSSYFLEWRLRSNYVDFETFFYNVGLGDIVEKCHQRCEISLEEYIYYCEYMLNVLEHPKLDRMSHTPFIRDNISRVLERLNYTSHVSDGIYHIVEKSVLVSEAADILQENYDLGEGVYSFNYQETKGNLVRKADILCRLYKYIESITPQAKQYGYSTLLDDIKDLSNKLDVRHAPTIKQGIIIGDMDASEYEEWLDEIFRLSLSLILLVEYTTRRKDIKELKSKLG